MRQHNDWDRVGEQTAMVRGLRRRMTVAERLLWNALRAHQLDGMKFRRQHPFGPFVLDFCCVESRLVVELDGGIHDEQVEQDVFRTQFINAYGFRVVRFRNEDVMTNLESVLTRIREAASGERVLPLSRAPGEGAGG